MNIFTPRTKFWLMLLGLVVLGCGSLSAQISNPQIILVSGAPSGSCTNPGGGQQNLPDEQVITLGTIYTCQSGTWALVPTSGGGGGGTVTSVALTGSNNLFSGTPGTAVTTAGTLNVDSQLATQVANCIFAGPSSGSAATPTCRALVAADISGLAAASVSNSDGTLTISPTTGAVVSSLNLTHTNTWTGQQTFGNVNTILSSANTTSTNLQIQNTSAGGHTYYFTSSGSANTPGHLAIFDGTESVTFFDLYGGTSSTVGQRAALSQNGTFGWTAGAATAALTTGLSQDSAGAMDLGNGTPGDKSGKLNLGTVTFAAAASSTNCSSAASPAVCAAAAAGSVALPTNAVSSSIVVNTTAVTANSQIFVTTDDTLGTKLGVTCNSTVATLVGGLTISARTAGTSFTISNNVAVVTNPLCVSYLVIN